MTDAHNDDAITLPPGLLGGAASFIYSASARPSEPLALAGAIALFSGICGRAFNVKGMGLNSMVVALAPSGTGKSFIGRGMRTIIRAVAASNPNASMFIGPPEIASGPALLRVLAARRIPSFVSVWGEFGLRIKQITDERAPSHLSALHRLILDLFTASAHGEEVGETVYSDPTKNSPAIRWPAFSILGEGTQTSFYPYITERTVELGLVPRLNIFEYDGRKPLPINEDAHLAVPSDTFLEGMGRLVSRSLAVNDAGSVIDVAFDTDAEAMQRQFKRHCYTMQDNAATGVASAIWSRAWAKLVKLAALVAVGVDCENPTIDVETLEWARVQIDRDIRKLIGKFEEGAIGVVSSDTDHDRQTAYVLKVIVRWTTCRFEELPKNNSAALHAAKFVPWRYISMSRASVAAFKNDRDATKAIRRAVDNLIKEDRISRVDASHLGTTMECFILNDPSAI